MLQNKLNQIEKKRNVRTTITRKYRTNDRTWCISSNELWLTYKRISNLYSLHAYTI